MKMKSFLVTAVSLGVCVAVSAPSLHATMLGGYLFDGTTVDQGGDTTVDLSLGSCAGYSSDTPFSYSGNMSLDVGCGIQARAALEDPSNIDAFEFENTDAFSIKAWFKSAGAGGFRAVAGQRETGGGAQAGNGYYIGIGSDSKAFMFTQGTTVGQGRGATGTSLLDDGEWHSIVGVHDPASDLDGLGDGEIFLYVDGALENSHKKTQTETIAYGASKFAVGLNRGVAGNFNAFVGLIDEVGVFDHALTQPEVTAAHENSMVPEPASMLLLGLCGMVSILGRRRS